MFEYYVSAGGCHLKYAQGKPAVIGREFHSYDEIVLFLEGSAQLISQSIQLRLTPGSLILIPREQFHQFVVTDSDTYTRCILGFQEISGLRDLVRQVMTDVMVMPKPSGQAVSVFQTLMLSARAGLPEEEIKLLLCSAVTQLLFDQKLSGDEPIRRFVTASPLTQEALRYIDSHLSGQLCLEHIALELGVSVSSLCHRFRKDLNISVYRYISEKRLSAVRQYMAQGLPLGAAAAKSGFRDYSGFFRLYKSYYGESPSASAKVSHSPADI